MEIDLQAAGMFLARCVLGILFLFQAYDKLFDLGPGRVRGMVSVAIPSSSKALRSMATPAIMLSSVVQLIAGALLITGLFRELALLALVFDMLLTALAFSMVRPMWEMDHFLPRLLLLLLLLLLPASWDTWSLGTMLGM